MQKNAGCKLSFGACPDFGASTDPTGQGGGMEAGRSDGEAQRVVVVTQVSYPK